MHARELLQKGLIEKGIHCSEIQADAFMTYLSELKKWNRTYNLTALKKDEDIITKHFIDSLLYVKVIPDNVLKIADAGSGAGFPGIPLKILRPETEITLFEPSRKKTSFLRHMTRVLGFEGMRVCEQRIEERSNDCKEKFDCVVSRATFSIKGFLTAACPRVREGGILVLSKGPKITEEINELEKSSGLNHSLREFHRFHLPFDGAERNLIVLVCRGN